MEARHSLWKSFQFAFNGLKTAVIKGRNFKIELWCGMMAVILGIMLGISPAEWANLILIIACVLILELFNTAIESIVNIVSPKIKEQARIAKDVSAAAVFVACLAAVFIGLILFLPKIFY